MNKHFLIACAVSFVAVAAGIAAALHWGTTLPPWLMTFVLSLMMLLALAYGFTGVIPRLHSLRSRPVKGAALICLGVAAPFVPPQFVIAALCIGNGTRLVWLSACDQEKYSFITDAEIDRAKARDLLPYDNHRGVPRVRGESAYRSIDASNGHEDGA